MKFWAVNIFVDCPQIFSFNILWAQVGQNEVYNVFQEAFSTRSEGVSRQN